jgi:5-formyltetrahydrofolate cyclo-ligase
MTIEAQKNQLRAEMKERLRTITPEEHKMWSKEICDELTKRDFSKIKVVAAFYPLHSEPNILPFLHALQTQGKVIALPRLEKESSDLKFYAVSEWNTLEKDEMGILQPLPEVEVPSEKMDLIIVPGLAFDKEGNRLGRSKGLYDRFLSSVRNATLKIGVCFDLQIVASLPSGELDQKVNQVFSNSSFL